jgi:hypothetical protein
MPAGPLSEYAGRGTERDRAVRFPLQPRAPHQGRACQNRPPRVAFPVLPTLPALPILVDPDCWLEEQHGQAFSRRVKVGGRILVDGIAYYVKQALAGQMVTLLVNALYSLYSALPHTFKLQGSAPSEAPSAPALPPLLKKLAIIVVSSRKCDENLKSPDSYIATILGKVIGLERGSNDTITVRTLNTFAANQHSQELFRRPDVIIEQVKKYHRQGYQHFLYVAHAPYSSNLNVSDSDEQDLFFMNKDVIRAMRGVDPAIRIYPAFCDKYYVINRKIPATRKGPLLRADSLYIDDIGDLTSVSNDPSRRSQLFLNLFNGIRINPDAIYNGVMSYATLITVYANDPTYDQYIWNDLLNASVPNSMKAEIFDFITLLHFARYEKASQQKYPIGFKLDPYTDIIGDSSVGARSIFPNMNDGRARFNALAFLAVVRAVMHASTK